MSKFNSFVSIDLNDYNALILKNKEQEETINKRCEEIMKLKEDKEMYETILKNSLVKVAINDSDYYLERIYNNKDSDNLYNKEVIFERLRKICGSVSIVNECVELAIKEFELIKQGETNGN